MHNPVATIIKNANKFTNEELNDKIQSLEKETRVHVLALIIAERPPSEWDLKFLREAGLLKPTEQ